MSVFAPAPAPSSPIKSQPAAPLPASGPASAPAAIEEKTLDAQDLDGAAERERALRLLMLAAFTSMASMRWCDALLPALSAEFASTPGQTGSVVYGFALAYGAMQLFYGPLGDRIGKFRVVSMAVLACTVGAIACALAPGLGWLTAARVLNGAAAAGVIPLAMAWVGDNAPWSQRQPLLARLMGATVIGMITGQWMAGLFADTVGWRWGFVAVALLFGTAGIAMRRSLRQGGASTARPAAGSIGSLSSLARMREVLTSQHARRVLAVVAAEGAFAISAMAFAPTHLHDTFGLAVSAAGAILALYGLGGFLYTRSVRWLMARLKPSQMAQLGGILAGTCWVLFALSPAWPFTLPLCALAGMGFYMIHNTLQAQATEMAPTQRGTAVSLFACTLFFGQSIGLAAVAALVDRWSTGPVLAGCGVGLALMGVVVGWVVKRSAEESR